MPRPSSVLRFWFKESKPKDWFTKNRSFDQKIKKRFGSLYESVVRSEKDAWRNTPKGRLAEIIVLDQFSRNLFRGRAQAFAQDTLALALAQEAIRTKADKKLTTQERPFLYMPFMHSESKLIQRRSVALFTALGLSENLWYAKEHKKIIDRFGRYPHRNRILKRASTKREKEFLKTHKGF